MSRSGLSRSFTADATRQKLDELDALIQQMLNLPVHRLEAVEEDRGQRTEDREQRTEDKEQKIEDRGQKTEDREQETEKDREQGKEDREQKVEEARGQRAEDNESKPEEDRPCQPVAPSSVLCSASPHWWLYPILGLNLLFDGLTFLLGPLGRWLRSETGRLLMGWAGVALFLAALVWTFLGWMGWIN